MERNFYLKVWTCVSSVFVFHVDCIWVLSMCPHGAYSKINSCLLRVIWTAKWSAWYFEPPSVVFKVSFPQQVVVLLFWIIKYIWKVHKLSLKTNKCYSHGGNVEVLLKLHARGLRNTESSKEGMCYIHNWFILHVGTQRRVTLRDLPDACSYKFFVSRYFLNILVFVLDTCIHVYNVIK